MKNFKVSIVSNDDGRVLATNEYNTIKEINTCYKDLKKNQRISLVVKRVKPFYTAPVCRVMKSLEYKTREDIIRAYKEDKDHTTVFFDEDGLSASQADSMTLGHSW